MKTFKNDYLLPPNKEQTEVLLERADALGLSGMLGSIDCYKWIWKNYPTAHHGQFVGKKKEPTVMMESIVEDILYIWHAFFRIAGCNNYLTVLDRVS